MWSAWVSLVSFHGNESCGLHGSVLFPFMVVGHVVYFSGDVCFSKFSLFHSPPFSDFVDIITLASSVHYLAPVFAELNSIMLHSCGLVFSGSVAIPETCCHTRDLLPYQRPVAIPETCCP